MPAGSVISSCDTGRCNIVPLRPTKKDAKGKKETEWGYKGKKKSIEGPTTF
jgi:hypothetical protein